MPGIPEAPPSPFAHPAWDWNESIVTNLSRGQDRLRRNRYHRLKQKWICELEFAGTYWTYRGGKFAHFGRDGSFRVHTQEGQSSDKLENFRSYKRTADDEIVMYSEGRQKGDSTRISISAIRENSIMLVGPDRAPIAVIDRATSSSFPREL